MSLFVGAQVLDCQIRKDITHVFDDSNEELKTLHGVSRERYQFVASSYRQLRTSGGRGGARIASTTNPRARQKTILTSLEEAAESQRSLVDAVENEREAAKMRRRQRETERDKGITRAFLENDSSPDESAEPLSRIKQRFGMNKKRRT
eukprot:GHVQ01036421.1.p1 GENE.GHVQ01036421.1~~GHVQ01036421.1.p1  ORF type:complete len:148 (+),score=25.53 GHVQ01036421.1:3-446(+)